MTTVAESKLVLRPELNGVQMTPREFDAADIDDELHVYELINGVLIVSPPPLEEERDPNEELGFMLRSYQKEHPRGAALDKTLPEHRIHSRNSRRRADRAIWAGLGRTPSRDEAPTIAVEFVSSGRRNWLRDFKVKRREYKAVGVKEYWIIDRFRRTMTVFVNRGGLSSELVVHEGEIYRTPLLPGFELALARLLAIADEWDKPAAKGRSRNGKRRPKRGA